MPLVLCTNSASIVEFEKNHGIVSYNADGPITTEFLSIAQLIVNGCSAPIIELSKFDKRKMREISIKIEKSQKSRFPQVSTLQYSHFFVSFYIPEIDLQHKQ